MTTALSGMLIVSLVCVRRVAVVIPAGASADEQSCVG
jgi:hypothetical protein